MSRWRHVPLLAVLLVPPVASAAPPKVPGSVTIRPGEITSVEVQADPGKEVAWAAGFAPESCYVDEGKPLRKDTCRLIVCPKVAGVHRVILWTVGEREHSVLVIDASGNPAPVPPQPNPVPVPVPKPDGKLGLVKASREGMAKVPQPNRETGAAALAKAQRSIASAVAAGGLTEPAAILNAWREANKAAVSNAEAWKVWGETVSPALAKSYSDGKLPDKAAWASAFEEIAQGLDGG